MKPDTQTRLDPVTGCWQSSPKAASFADNDPTYKQSLNFAPIGIAVIRHDGSIVRANQRLCDLLALDRAEIETRSLCQILSPLDSEPLDLPLEAVSSGETREFSTQISYAHPAFSAKVWLRLTIAASDAIARSKNYLVCTFEDVTAREAEQRAFEYQKWRYEQLLALSASLPGALSIYRLLTDGTSVIEFVTPSFSHLLGYSPGELGPDGQVTFFKNVHPEDVSGLIASITEAAERQVPWRAEYRVNHPARGLINISETAAPEVEPDGSIVWYCFVQDVTERTRDQAKLRQAAAVFQNSQEAIAIVDPEGFIVAVNPSFQALSGFHSHQIQGQLPFLKLVRGNSDTVRQALKVIRKRRSWQGEVQIRTTKGTYVPQWVVVSPVQVESGKTTSFVVSMLDISRIKQTERKLNHIASHDSLTGLPNRMLLNQRLDALVPSARAKGRKGAILFIDLDRFKTVNDSLGHKAGDELLRTISERLRGRVRGDDMVARLGGDEFVVVLNQIENDADAGKVAREIIEIIEAPVTVLSRHDVYVSASIGISYFPKDGQTGSELIQCADAALYSAKEHGRGTFRYYDISLINSANLKLETETRMRRALVKKEFELYYQPIVDINRGAVVGAEALIRWHDPVNGFVQPLDFIPLAEETGFIVPLGDWIIRASCLQLNKWQQAGLRLDLLSINLSARQFRLADLPERIALILQETGVSPRRIRFEITESALMSEGDEAVRKLMALKQLGVRLSIDDFGTGYSSLSMLKRFPIDTLKIDRSFIKDVIGNNTSRQIALAIISLAKTLNLEIVAEGIEDREQMHFAARHGCQFAQGFYFSKPIPAADFQYWLSSVPSDFLEAGSPSQSELVPTHTFRCSACN